MKNAIFLTAMILVSTGLVACDNSSAKKDADKAATDINNLQVVVEAGNYQVALDCGDAEKNAKLPSLAAVYSLKADGTYSEAADIEVGTGKKISVVLRGTFEATASSFTFNQENAMSTDGEISYSGVAATKKFTVVGYAKSEGKIILQDEESDNVCNGKMLFVLVKK